MQRYVYPGYEMNLCVTLCSQMWIYSNLKIILQNTTSKDLPCVFSCSSESSLFLSKAASFFFFKLFPSACSTCPWFPGFIHPWNSNFPTCRGGHIVSMEPASFQKAGSLGLMPQLFPQVPSKRRVVQQCIKQLHSRRFPLAMCLPSCVHLNFESKHIYRDFPSGPVAETWCSQCKGPGFPSWSGN